MQPNLIALLKQLEQPKPSHLAWVHTGAGNTTRVLSVAEILYFQAGEKYTEVVTAEGRRVIRTPLRELTQRLDPVQFVQIHRSTIVNLHSVERLERDVLGRSLIHLKNRPAARQPRLPVPVPADVARSIGGGHRSASAGIASSTHARIAATA